MLSRAQEARVREVLADLAAFVWTLWEHAACQTQYGGIRDADESETTRLQIW